MIFVLLVIAVALGIASQSYGVYLRRSAAKRAAQLFARDLSLTRAVALRDRQPASLVILEDQNRYVIRRPSGDVVIGRDYGPGSGLRLSLLDLQLPGDSVAFNARGLADLSGAPGSLGVARFVAGSSEYLVRFNGMGVSDVQQP